MGVPQSVGEELAATLQQRFPGSTATYVGTVPGREASLSSWPEWTLPSLREYFFEQGISAPFSHQVATAQAAWEGRDVVVATGTSSGKSLGYLLPVLTALAHDATGTALYLTPTKALGSDQWARLDRICRAVPELRGVVPSPYDGDTPTEARRAIRDNSRLLLTNPDMVHAALCGAHARFARILRHLRFIVIDECHTYRGVFGAHVAIVIRRLLRIAARYGAHPTIILASATAFDPAAHAQRLTGRPAVAVTEDGAPRGSRTIVLWEPGFLEDVEGEHGAPVRRAATTEAADIMATLIGEGARTLTFVRSRHGAEVVSLRAQETLALAGRFADAKRVAAYRAGYLAEDRRALEAALDDGRLLGVSTTNALELGIDVGSLDAVVSAGFPGTIASFWQQAGRAGRRGQGSIAVLVARDDPMDTFVVHHPDALLGAPVEDSVFNPRNPHVLRGHVVCASVEFPLTPADVEEFGAGEVVAELAAEGVLRWRGHAWFPTVDDPHSEVHIRGTDREIMIVDQTDGRLLGTVDGARAPASLHPGAVYTHQGEMFVVDDLLLDDALALVHPDQPEYTTRAHSSTDIRIVDAPAQEDIVKLSTGVWLANVDVEVTQQVTHYTVRTPNGETIDTVPLDMPAQQLRTRAVAYTVDPLVLRELGITEADVPGALHAAEHAAIGLLPLIATCDRWDIGGVSTALHADTQLPTVFVYDGTPGGAGFADAGFRRFAQWITATYEAVKACPCEAGCPSCVQSPKCGNGNQPLHKEGALALLGGLVTMFG
ncbi:DEAD/DEAH box helicase [Corynebacterium renale]|uniref:DEAD/DEAH box helicase n=1 Tax=Corynebacterium renale TaxID=1724 RepID=UPI000DA38FA5|nr:DEAD/DEAH box helicase [Corynebacterium renale]SQG63871.1 DEAD/DEAH box helicase [Corynebacterium renale]STD02549.1 DEAD/DEAH box helicase [Corynebacterium renale]